ncbi:ABC transporter substrate-binding protein [Chryseolinea sp. T2]|uniref:ABC transporter substrate-binding protein n=1 Tax=Chryseolinea sp. T2 TaxID=3129255 RepID=UPI00307873A2
MHLKSNHRSLSVVQLLIKRACRYSNIARYNFISKRLPNLIVVSLILLLCTQCKTDKPDHATTVNGDRVQSLKYAQGFTVRYDGNKKWVEVKTPYQGATSGYTYLLVPRDEEVPPVDADVKVIRVPLNSIVCTSTSHLPLLEYLGEDNKLTGFPETDYISSEKIRQHVDAGKVFDLGVDKSMNLEQLANLHPDLVMGYSMTSDYGQFKKMEALGVPVVINAEYLEKHPLGRAEWIKFMALFFNKEEIADSIFNSIDQLYQQTKASADTVALRPTVLSGIVYGDAWFMPGGQNYAAKLFADAGCNYLWREDASTGFLELDFESVYSKAHEADLWIGVGSHSTLKSLGDGDHRYRNFKAFQSGKVFTYDALKGAKGGSVYLELGYLRPDIILRDLVRIAHPALLPDYSLYFHRQLE